jgi:hypothetical protein
MMNMQPTMKLRFVERGVLVNENTFRPMKILQQWWAGFTDEHGTDIEGEWRDVPVEIEQ